MPTATETRCKRCGTILRGRTLCPSCGLDLNAMPAPAGEISAKESSGGNPSVPRQVKAKAGVKICPVCMQSVAEEQLVDEGGQKLCPTCAENMKNKAAKKGAPTPG